MSVTAMSGNLYPRQSQIVVVFLKRFYTVQMLNTQTNNQILGLLINIAYIGLYVLYYKLGIDSYECKYFHITKKS